MIQSRIWGPGSVKALVERIERSNAMTEDRDNTNDSLVRIIRALEAAGYVVRAIKPETLSDGDRLTGATTVVVYPVRKS